MDAHNVRVSLVTFGTMLKAQSTSRTTVASAEAFIEAVAAQLLPLSNPASFLFLPKVFPTQPPAGQSHS